MKESLKLAGAIFSIILLISTIFLFFFNGLYMSGASKNISSHFIIPNSNNELCYLSKQRTLNGNYNNIVDFEFYDMDLNFKNKITASFPDLDSNSTFTSAIEYDNKYYLIENGSNAKNKLHIFDFTKSSNPISYDCEAYTYIFSATSSGLWLFQNGYNESMKLALCDIKGNMLKEINLNNQFYFPYKTYETKIDEPFFQGDLIDTYMQITNIEVKDNFIYLAANLASKRIAGSYSSQNLMGAVYCIDFDGNVVWECFLSPYTDDGSGIHDITNANDFIFTDDGLLVAGSKGVYNGDDDLPERDRYLISSPTIFEVDYNGEFQHSVSYDNKFKTTGAVKIFLNNDTIYLLGTRIENMSFYDDSFKNPDYFSVTKGFYKDYAVESNVSDLIDIYSMYFNGKVYTEMSIFNRKDHLIKLERFDTLEKAINMKRFLRFNRSLQYFGKNVVLIELFLIAITFGSLRYGKTI